MISVVQRVHNANVSVDGKVVGEISKGLLVFLGIDSEDTAEDLEFMVKKVAGLRIFNDESGKMNLSVQDLGFEILVISQFTLLGDVRKGFRPSYQKAARPEKAIEMYETFIDKMKETGLRVESGVFGAMMNIDACNDGPVTIVISS